MNRSTPLSPRPRFRPRALCVALAALVVVAAFTLTTIPHSAKAATGDVTRGRLGSPACLLTQLHTDYDNYILTFEVPIYAGN